jgi:hypothetical protein
MTARKSDHLKLLAGTSRRDRAAPEGPGLPALDGVPSPPSWMTDINAVREWNNLAPLLVTNKLLSLGNSVLLAHLCMLSSRFAATWASGATPTAALLRVHRALASDLGLVHLNVPAPAADKPNRFRLIAQRRRR